MTQTSVPSLDVITRTGWQPASTVATTDAAGSVSARRRETAVSVPCPASSLLDEVALVGSAISLVAYSQRPSGETASPTGASPSGMAPT